MLYEHIWDEVFFLIYHMHMTLREAKNVLTVGERKRLIQKFIEQRERENEAIEKERKKR